MAPRRRLAPIVALSGPSGSGKTRLAVRLLARLRREGLDVGYVKHAGHRHRFDPAGKDTARARRAGAVAAAVTGPVESALFLPPVAGARALARLLPPVDLVLAEGFRSDRLPRLELHRRAVDRAFLCARDRGVIAVVTDEPPPRPLPTFQPDDVAGIARFLLAWLGRTARPGRGKR